MCEKTNENADRPRLEDAGAEGTIGDFTLRLRETAAKLLRDQNCQASGWLRLAGLLQTAATLIDNTRPAANWLRRQPRYRSSGDTGDYTAAEVVDLLERYARDSPKEGSA